MARIKNGHIVITPRALPMFVFGLDGFSYESMEDVLLKSKFLLGVRVPSFLVVLCNDCSLMFLKCIRSIYTGPRTAYKLLPGPTGGGRACLAKVYGIKEITPRMIAYVASLVTSIHASLIRSSADSLFASGTFWTVLAGTVDYRRWRVFPARILRHHRRFAL